jgi:hypothetical protein
LTKNADSASALSAFFYTNEGLIMHASRALCRRAALAGGLAGFLSLAAPRAGAAPDDKNLERFIKMRGALDGRLVIGGVTGAYYGAVNGRVTPLFGLVSAVFSHYQAQNGAYQLTEFEQAYYTDLETGKALTHWQNPYTHEIVTVPVYSAPAARSFINADLQFHASAPTPPNVQVAHFVQGPEISADEITFIERVAVRVAPSAGKPAFDYQDQTSLTAQLSDVDQPDTRMTGSKTRFAAVCSWRPWLNMGARPGHMTASGQGSFGIALADLPAAWREATARLRPELLKQE